MMVSRARSGSNEICEAREARQPPPSPDDGRKKAPYFRTGLLHLIDAWQFPTRMGRPHTTIGATAFHF